MTQRIVINTRHSGFGLSDEASNLYWSISKSFQLVEPGVFDNYNTVYRHNPLLVYVVEKLGKAANGLYSNLKIVDVPEGVQWQVDEYDGREWVAEVHRTWE